jgi:hypothetical protein
VNETVVCIRAAGYQVTDPQWSGGLFKYDVQGFSTEAALKAAKPSIEACYEQHLRSIDLVWQAGVGK